MIITTNDVSLASAAKKNLLEVTDTVDKIDESIPWSLSVAFDVSFLLLIDQRESTKYRVSKEGKVSSNTFFSIPDI